MNTFHEGELSVQRQAGVQHMAQRVGSGIGAEIPDVFSDFLDEQRLAVLASVDAAGQVWASILTGRPGFMRAEDERTVSIRAAVSDHDLWRDHLSADPTLGVLVIDLSTRRRIRLNGTGQIDADGNLRLTTQEVYGNCPKYIQARRDLPLEPAASPRPTVVERGTTLTDAQQRWIATADTFFIASHMPGRGADASHRGGGTGFVRVVNDQTLEFPDYAGNMMFNTLGNLAANPNAGVLFVDFDAGTVLQLTGQATIHWDGAHRESHPGAERVVSFRVSEVREVAHALPLRFKFLSFSKHNPPIGTVSQESSHG